MYPIDREYIPGTVEKINQMNKWVAENAKTIQDLVMDGRLIAGGEKLDKRTMDKINAITRASGLHVALVKVWKYSITLETETCYPTGTRTAKYARVVTILVNLADKEWKRYEIEVPKKTTVEEVVDLIDRLRIQKEVSQLENYRLKALEFELKNFSK